ncbi:MAG: LPS export ABC transporter protein LptC [Paraglaciecola sp.]|jgi:LPS export ABC transporter protein LptC
MLKYLSILIIGSLFIACENDIAEVQKYISKDLTAVETAKEIEMLYSDSAMVKVRVTSPTLIRHLDNSNPRQEFPDGISMEFLNASHRTTSRMTAKYALRFEKEGKVVMRDSVVWLSEKNEQLETEELIWEETKDKVYTKKFVVIRKAEEIIYGHGFESNKDFTEWRINAIQGRKKINN